MIMNIMNLGGQPLKAAPGEELTPRRRTVSFDRREAEVVELYPVSPDHSDHSLMRPSAWTCGFFDDNVATRCAALSQPPPPPLVLEPEALEVLQDEGPTHDYVKILETAYALKGEAAAAVEECRWSVPHRRGEAFRNSVCNIRSVIRMTAQLFAGDKVSPSLGSWEATPPPQRREPTISAPATAFRTEAAAVPEAPSEDSAESPPSAPGSPQRARFAMPPAALTALKAMPPSAQAYYKASQGAAGGSPDSLGDRFIGGHGPSPRGSPRSPEADRLRAALESLELQRSNNEELGRTLAELTAELQRAGVIGEVSAAAVAADLTPVSPLSPAQAPAVPFIHPRLR